MNAGWYWTRATWRRAARGGALLALLVALSVGGAIGAAAGARRTATAFDRLRARSNPPDAFVFSADAGAFNRIAHRPDVAAATGYVQLGLQPAGVPCSDRSEDYYQVLVPAAGTPFSVPKPRLLKGRYADPSAPDEAVVSEQHARRLGVGVGDTIRYLAYDVDDSGRDVVGCLKDTVAKVRVVGVIRELLEIGAGDEPTVAATYLTPAFRRAHSDAPPITGVNGFARLKAGANADRFAEDVARTAPSGDGGEPAAGAVTIHGTGSLAPPLDALAFGLWVLAGALAAAAAVAVTVAIVRQVAATAPDLRLLAALGLSRRQAAFAAAVPILMALAVGLGLAVAVAGAVSTVHLVGVAAAAEPNPGLALDPPVLLAGLSFAALAGLAVVALATWRGAADALDQPENDTAGRPGVVDRGLRRRLPPWAAMGSSYAVGPGRGAASVPARAAAAAVGAATAGLVAVLVFGVGVTHAKRDSSVYGFGGWDGFASNADEESDADVAPIAAADPDVATVARLSARFKLPIGGTTTNGFAVEDVEGRTGPTVVRGRLPAGAGEIALGKDTAARLRAGVGSTVPVDGPNGPSRLRVVGIAAFPNIDGDPLASGWVADRAAIDALGWPPGCNDEAECFNTVAFSWRPGADVRRATARLHDGGVEIEPAHPGREVILVGEAALVPAFGVAGLGLVAALSLAHTLSVTVTRRRRELAVVRAVGFDRRQAAGVIVTQAVVLAVVGGVAGGVAGLAAGRSAWRAAARSIGIGSGLPSIAALVVLVVGGVLVLSLGLAVLPAVRVARSSPAAGLRGDE